MNSTATPYFFTAKVQFRQVLFPAMFAPFMALTGYRFDKSWRNARTGFKFFVYGFVSTPVANIKADLYRTSE